MPSGLMTARFVLDISDEQHLSENIHHPISYQCALQGGLMPTHVRQTWKGPPIVETRLAKLYLRPMRGIDVVTVTVGGEETQGGSAFTRQRVR